MLSGIHIQCHKILAPIGTKKENNWSYYNNTNTNYDNKANTRILMFIKITIKVMWLILTENNNNNNNHNYIAKPKSWSKY